MRVGLVDCGLPLCRTAWANAEVTWEIDARAKTRTRTLPECPVPAQTYSSVTTAPLKLLQIKPVDLLVMDHSHQRAAEFFSRGRDWTQWLDYQRPKRIVEIWQESDVRTVVGLPGKSHCENLTMFGYQKQQRIVRATEVGRSAKHGRMIVIHPTIRSLAPLCRDMSGEWEPNPASRIPRPIMSSNLLTCNWTGPE
jgi:hypothetical protein